MWRIFWRDRTGVRTPRTGSEIGLTVASWQPQSRDAVALRLDAAVEVEPLALEEIFLELHR